MSLDLSLADLQWKPFPYALFDSVFPDAIHDSLLKWLENTKLWNLSRTDFYEQYEFALNHVALPPTAQFLVEPAFKSILRARMEEFFNFPLSPSVDIQAHKLAPGQHIGIHNDMRHGGENLRFTVQLNRGLNEPDGGYFILFNSGDVRDVHRILRPIHNSALAFAVSEKSHHAVTIQHQGTRFTLVFSFFPADAPSS